MTSCDAASGSMRPNATSRELGVGETGSDSVHALFERHEAHDETVRRVAHHHAEIRERADEQRVADAQQVAAVVGHLGELGDRDHERRRGLAAVGPRRVGVDRVQDDVGRRSRARRSCDVTRLAHRRGRPGDEALEHRAGAEIVAGERLRRGPGASESSTACAVRSIRKAPRRPVNHAVRAR